jgi:hypothetical protein
MGDVILYGRQVLLKTSVDFVVGRALRSGISRFVHFRLRNTPRKLSEITNA